MRHVFLAALAAAVLTAAGCATPPGGKPASGVLQASSFGRTLSRDFLQIVEVSREVVEVNANGRTVRAAAPQGYCIPVEGVLTGRASVFLVMERCRADEPGVLSVSIGKKPLFDEGGATPARLAGLERFLRTEDGRRNLGFDAGSGAIFLKEATITDGALIAMVEDGSGAGPEFVGATFAKAFAEINGRVVVLTLLNQKGAEKDAAALSAQLIEIVAGMRAANKTARSS